MSQGGAAVSSPGNKGHRDRGVKVEEVTGEPRWAALAF